MDLFTLLLHIFPILLMGHTYPGIAMPKGFALATCTLKAVNWDLAAVVELI